MMNRRNNNSSLLIEHPQTTIIELLKELINPRDMQSDDFDIGRSIDKKLQSLTESQKNKLNKIVNYYKFLCEYESEEQLERPYYAGYINDTRQQRRRVI